MPNVDLNWWAIVVATVVNMVIGALWYSPLLFANQWLKLMGRKKEDMQGDKLAYPMTALGAFVQSVILAHFVVFTAYFYPTRSDFAVGVTTAIWLWLGFVGIVQATNALFAKTNKKLYAINVGYFLVVLLINGVILASWH